MLTSKKSGYCLLTGFLVLFLTLLFNPILISILYPKLDSFIESDKYIIIHKTFFVWAIPTVLLQLALINLFRLFTKNYLQRQNLETRVLKNIKTQINDLLLVLVGCLAIQYIGYIWSLFMAGLVVPLPYSKKLILIVVWVASLPLLYPLFQFFQFRRYLSTLVR